MFLDANIFIHAYDSTGQRFISSRRLLSRISKGEMNAKTSVLVLNEVLYFFSQKNGPDEGVRVFSNLRKTPHLEILGVEASDMEHVPDLITQGLDASDAYHAAVMRSNDIETIFSYDKAFDKIKSIRRKEPV